MSKSINQIRTQIFFVHMLLLRIVTSHLKQVVDLSSMALRLCTSKKEEVIAKHFVTQETFCQKTFPLVLTFKENRSWRPDFKTIFWRENSKGLKIPSKLKFQLQTFISHHFDLRVEIIKVCL